MKKRDLEIDSFWWQLLVFNLFSFSFIAEPKKLKLYYIINVFSIMY